MSRISFHHRKYPQIYPPRWLKAISRGNWADSAWNLERAHATRYLSSAVRLSGRDCTCIVVHPHTLPCPRERVDTAVRLPNRTGVPSSTALSLFLSRPLHPVNRSPVEARSYGRVQRRVNANFTRSITFSTWIIRYSRRACCRHAVSRSREAGTARVDEFRTIRVRVYSNWQMEFRVRYRILSKETKILIRAILSVEQKVMESN